MNLNKLIRLIINLSKSHPSIKYTGVGNRYDLFGYEGAAPYLWIINEDSHRLVYSEHSSYNIIEYSLTLRVGDYNNNQVNVLNNNDLKTSVELDVLNDTAWILSDFINIIANNTTGDFDNYNLIDDILIEPFFREEESDMSGHEATLVFRATMQPCVSPINYV